MTSFPLERNPFLLLFMEQNGLNPRQKNECSPRLSIGIDTLLWHIEADVHDVCGYLIKYQISMIIPFFWKRMPRSEHAVDKGKAK